MMKKKLTIDDVFTLTVDVLTKCGCDNDNANAIGRTIAAAERDGCQSHGLFRLPGYIASLKSGKVNGSARPNIVQIAPSVLRADGHNGYAPLILELSRPELTGLAKKQGIAALSIVRSHHFSALWVEVSALAEQQLCAMAFTAYTSAVVPAGGSKALFGTNPMAFAWPRGDKPPMVFDQASAAMAKGEVMIAARDGHTLPEGVGVDSEGKPTTDPQAVLNGAMLPFGGYKGASIALMIELLVGPLIGEHLSFEAKQSDNGDGGPPQGGEFIIAIDPTKFGASETYIEHTEKLFSTLLAQEGTRLPGDRRYQNRKLLSDEQITIPESLYLKILDQAEL